MWVRAGLRLSKSRNELSALRGSDEVKWPGEPFDFERFTARKRKAVVLSLARFRSFTGRGPMSTRSGPTCRTLGR
jgi:hypothetical protein